MKRLLLGMLLLPVVATAGPATEPGFVGFHAEPLANLSAGQKAELKASGDHGVYVSAVVSKGPAAAAGMQVGDRLLRFGTNDVPDLFSTERETHHLWRVAMRFLLGSTRAGEPVDVVVERGGKTLALKLTPVGATDMHRLQADELWTEPPALADAGAPTPFLADFRGLEADAQLPPGFHPYEGRWRVVRDGDNAVLRQERMILPWAVLLVAGNGRNYGDGTASVRFLPVSGVTDASAGIIFRAQDPLNYYVVRPNALEDNFRIYIVKDGVRTELASLDVTPPEKNTWHVLEVTFHGPNFRATLDGGHVVEARDGTFKSGWCGLWTKADSVTLFDDLKIVPGGSQ